MRLFSLPTFFLLLTLFLFQVGISHAAPAVGNAALLPLTEREVRAEVERFVAEKVAGRGWDVTVRQFTMPLNIRTSRGSRDLEFVVPPAWDGWGPVSAALVVRVNGIVERNVSVRLHVDARTDMVVANRQLLSGAVLTAEDVSIQKQDIALAGGQYVKSIDDLFGKKLRASVRAGAPIRGDQLVNVPVVVNGQMVTIILERPGLRISVAGRAKSAGAVGDLIRVQNLSSNREIPARVIDSSTVEVGF